MSRDNTINNNDGNTMTDLDIFDDGEEFDLLHQSWGGNNASNNNNINNKNAGNHGTEQSGGHAKSETLGVNFFDEVDLDDIMTTTDPSLAADNNWEEHQGPAGMNEVQATRPELNTTIPLGQPLPRPKERFPQSQISSQQLQFPFTTNPTNRSNSNSNSTTTPAVFHGPPTIVVPPSTATHSLPALNTSTSSPEDVDRLLASDMNRLSFQEREEAMNDLHGIVSIPAEEQPESMNALLKQMQHHLDQMQWLPDASAYRRAIQLNRDFVAWKRKMFLRAERYQPQEAAARMLRYFNMKLDLWGPDKICRRIVLKDLSEDDMDIMRTGALTVSPYKDTAGRILIWAEMSLKKQPKDVKCSLRASWYIYMSAVEDSDDSQLRGVVLIVMDIRSTYRSPSMTMRDTVPVKFAALHVHYLPTESPTVKIPVVMTQVVKEQSLQKRVRYRAYTGTHLQAKIEMMSYGIPIEAAPPRNKEGTCSISRHLEWMQKRWEIESKFENDTGIATAATTTMTTNDSNSNDNRPSHDRFVDTSPSLISRASPVVAASSGSSVCSNISTSSTAIVVIDDNDVRNDDVLFGKEKKVVNHPGNTRFRQLIDMYLASYEVAPRGEKTSISKVIVEHIHASSGRF